MSASGIEKKVIEDITERQQIGINKYGTTVADNPLSEIEWLTHAYEEMLDGAIYLKRLIEMKKQTSQDKMDERERHIFAKETIEITPYWYEPSKNIKIKMEFK